MAKIKFNQPKYVLPLMLLPVSALLFYLVKDYNDKHVKVSNLKEKQAFNADMPDPNLEKREVKDKFNSLKEAYKYDRDYSGVTALEKEIKVEGDTVRSIYTEDEKRLIDSVQGSIIKKEKPVTFTEKVRQKRDKQLAPIKKLAQQEPEGRSNSVLSKIKSATTSYAKHETPEQKQMKLFKQQMDYIDSLTNPEKKKPKVAPKPVVNKKKPDDSVFEAKKPVASASSGFNTISVKKDIGYIGAVIDEGITVIQGSRVRIRLLDDIQIGTNLVTKGTYLFGLVDGFNEQRLEIAITSIVVNDVPTKVSLSVYDNDGLPGLFVPNSNFRNFTKQLGSVSSSSAGQSTSTIQQDPANQTQLLYGLASNVVRAASQATSKIIKQNKAKLKYSTSIYLVNNQNK